MRRQAGFTLLETIIAMVISSMLVVVLVGVLFVTSRQGPKTSDELVAFRELQEVTQWINRDAAQARSFSLGSNPTYGTFTWPAYSQSPVVTNSVIYSYSGTDLIRQEISDGTPVASRAVAQNIANYGDVLFNYDSLARKIAATITVTVQPSLAADIITRTITTTVSLRPQFQVAAPSPAVVPTPTPLPAQVVFYCGEEPIALQGGRQSGFCVDMTSDDTSYYVAFATTGPIKYTSWEVRSQVITIPVVTAGNIVFLGQVTKEGTSQELYVYRAAGYLAFPDNALTYADKDIDTFTTFPLDQEALDYLNSLTGSNKRIRLKMRAFNNDAFYHSTDRLLFNVSGG